LRAAELAAWLNGRVGFYSEIVMIRGVELDVDAFVTEARERYRVVPCRNGPYSIVSDEFDQANPVPLIGCRQLHTDGLYLAEVPDFGMLYCSDNGLGRVGTILADSRIAIDVLRKRGTFDAMRGLQVEYTFGPGENSLHDLVKRHPSTSELVLHLGPNGIVRRSNASPAWAGIGEPLASIAELYDALKDAIVLRHEWSPGDLILFDNNTFVHGRADGPSDPARRLLRIWVTTRGNTSTKRTPPDTDMLSD
jgi:alpha-ketoglutarate-dependent taurine dioxygenase